MTACRCRPRGDVCRIEEAAIRFRTPFWSSAQYREDLRPEQRAEFVENLLAKQEEFESDRLARTDREYRDDLEARFDKQLKRYMGSLTSEQTTRIQKGWRK